MKWLLRRIGLQTAAPPPGAVAESVASPPEAPVAPAKAVVPRAERPVPFVPQGSHMPLFFLHIPKTSGSSVNRFLEQVYGRGNMVDHAENHLPKLLDGTRPAMQVDCVSAHVPLSHWSLYRGSDAYARATILRDPWDRLVSHVNWTNRFNNGEPLPTVGRSAEPTRRIVERLAETDFQSRDSLQRLFDTVRAEADFILFDNLQVRMLVTGNPNSNLRKPDETSLRKAQANLRQFAVWGICEDQAAFQARLLQAVGSDARPEPIRENVGKRLALTPDNDIAREVFAPWFELDRALYDSAIKMLRVRARKAQTI